MLNLWLSGKCELKPQSQKSYLSFFRFSVLKSLEIVSLGIYMEQSSSEARLMGVKFVQSNLVLSGQVEEYLTTLRAILALRHLISYWLSSYWLLWRRPPESDFKPNPGWHAKEPADRVDLAPRSWWAWRKEKRQCPSPATGEGKREEEREKRAAEDELVGWHHRFNGHELGQTPGDNERQGGLACCSSWGWK